MRRNRVFAKIFYMTKDNLKIRSTEFRVKILETHLDFFGHVNNAVYLQLFEEARWEAITERGFGVDTIRRLQQGPVILSVELKFLKELRLREEIVIQTDFLAYEGKVGRLLQKMINAKGEVACEAVFVFGLFDLQARKLLEPTREWRKACGFDVVS